MNRLAPHRGRGSTVDVDHFVKASTHTHSLHNFQQILGGIACIFCHVSQVDLEKKGLKQDSILLGLSSSC